MKKRKRNVSMFLSLFVLSGIIIWVSLYLYSPKLPEFVTRTPRTQDAYLFTQSNREVASVVPCFCGCMESLGHLSVYDCFIDNKGSYDPHGAVCRMCVEIALDTKELLNQGYTKEEITAFIKEKYEN